MLLAVDESEVVAVYVSCSVVIVDLDATVDNSSGIVVVIGFVDACTVVTVVVVVLGKNEVSGTVESPIDVDTGEFCSADDRQNYYTLKTSLLCQYEFVTYFIKRYR